MTNLLARMDMALFGFPAEFRLAYNRSKKYRHKVRGNTFVVAIPQYATGFHWEKLTNSE
jgi:hypothetical protein